MLLAFRTMLAGMSQWHKSVSFVLYFMLNLFVTYTNKQILGVRVAGAVQRPYLLTALHGAASFVGCVITQNLVCRKETVYGSSLSIKTSSLTWKQYGYLVLFSLFYTINIALSNQSLALVSLSLNQNIRAIAPVLTLIISILVLKKSPQAYNMASRISLIMITFGVIIAASKRPSSIFIADGAPQERSQNEIRALSLAIGISITFLGALTAVLKTVLTHKLMTSLSLHLSPLSLLRILSPYAVLQASSFAYFQGELDSPTHDIWPKGLLRSDNRSVRRVTQTQSYIKLPQHHNTYDESRMGISSLWILNPIAAFLLNLASFEANRSCGPVSMAVAANLKQIVFLILPVLVTGANSAVVGNEEITKNIIFGTVLTVSGGIWYAWETAKSKNRRQLPLPS